MSQAEIVRHSALMIVEEGGASDDPIPPLLPPRNILAWGFPRSLHTQLIERLTKRRFYTGGQHFARQDSCLLRNRLSGRHAALPRKRCVTPRNMAAKETCLPDFQTNRLYL